jgi:hypothetical protein
VLLSDSRESGKVPSDSPTSEAELLFDSLASEIELLFDSLASEDLSSSGSLKLKVELLSDSLEPADSYPK